MSKNLVSRLKSLFFNVEWHNAEGYQTRWNYCPLQNLIRVIFELLQHDSNKFSISEDILLRFPPTVLQIFQAPIHNLCNCRVRCAKFQNNLKEGGIRKMNLHIFQRIKVVQFHLNTRGIL